MDNKKVISSLMYKFAERFAAKALGFLISLVLARLLTPEAFGQIAILMVFINLSLVVAESGLSTALVQSREVDESDYSTVCYISMALAAVMVVVLYFTAPLISAFYDSPELTAPLRVHSLCLLFGAFNSIQLAMVQRELKFKQQLRSSLAATIGAGTVGIILAYCGAGLWALVAYYFGQTAIYCLALSLALRWRPREAFSPASAKRLYGFGSKMLVTSLMTMLFIDLRTLVVGEKFSTEAVGYYNRAQQFTTVISVNLDLAMQAVMFPVYSRSQDDPEHLRAMVRRSLSMAALLIFPAMLGMAAIAEPMVRLLLTDKWLPCVPLMGILCAAEMVLPLTSTNLVALKSMGKSDAYMKLEIVRRGVMLVILAVTVFCFDSVEAIAYGYAVSGWLDWAIASVPIKRYLDYGIGQQARDIGKPALAAAVMFLAVKAVGMLELPLAPALLLQLAVGAGTYVGACLALKSESFTYALELARSYMASRKSKGEPGQ